MAACGYAASLVPCSEDSWHGMRGERGGANPGDSLSSRMDTESLSSAHFSLIKVARSSLPVDFHHVRPAASETYAENMAHPFPIAIREDSIWKLLPEQMFRKHILALLEKSDQPIEPGLTFDRLPGPRPLVIGQVDRRTDRLLKLELEQSLAFDFAFLAATEEGARFVAACCIEEDTVRKQKRLTVRLAGNEGAPADVKDGIQDICDLLQSQLLRAASPRETRERVFTAILRLDRSRIRARVNSILGFLPSFAGGRRDPKAVSLRDVASRIRAESSSPAADDLALQLIELESQFKHTKTTFLSPLAKPIEAAEALAITDLVRACYSLSTNRRQLKMTERLFAAGLNGTKWINDKRISQIDKIGAYWRIARSLAEHFSPKGPLAPFGSIEVEPVSLIQGNTGTRPKAKNSATSHVHAELQMVVHYMLNHGRAGPIPRVIGVSKDACFLCFLFLGFYDTFQVPRTHGRLHEQWTIPDLKSFKEEKRATLRRTIEQMDHTIVRLSKQQHPRRLYVVQSRHNVNILPLSSVNSSVITVSGLSSIAEVLEEGQDPTRPLPLSGDASDASVNEQGEDVAAGQPELLEHEQASVEAVRDTVTASEPVQQVLLSDGASDKTLNEQRHITAINELESPVHEQAPVDMVGEQAMQDKQEVEEDSAAMNDSARSWYALSATPTLMDVGESKDPEIFVEVESPKRGRARISEQAVDPVIVGASIIDIGSMVPGEEVSLTKTDGSRSLMINLRGINNLFYQLELEWVA